MSPGWALRAFAPTRLHARDRQARRRAVLHPTARLTRRPPARRGSASSCSSTSAQPLPRVSDSRLLSRGRGGRRRRRAGRHGLATSDGRCSRSSADSGRRVRRSREAPCRRGTRNRVEDACGAGTGPAPASSDAVVPTAPERPAPLIRRRTTGQGLPLPDPRLRPNRGRHRRRTERSRARSRAASLYRTQTGRSYTAGIRAPGGRCSSSRG